MKRRAVAWTMAAALCLLLGAGAALAQPQTAQAELRDASGAVVGTATFVQEEGGVRVQVTLQGFAAGAGGERGVHIHENGACEPDFGAAGEHFNPEGLEHGLENPDGPHAGDLPNIAVDEAGNAQYEALNDRIGLDAEPGRSILAGDGTALIIHEAQDDQTTDPDGGSGAPIACGVILAADASAPEAPSPQVQSAQSNTFVPEQLRPTEELMAGLSLPEGFELNVFAEGLTNPRMMAQAEDGTIYVTLRNAGRVIALRDTDGDGVADEMDTLYEEMPFVHGVTLHEGFMYLMTDRELHRAPLAEGGPGELETLADDLPDAGQHPNRTLAFGPDGLLYLSIGSTCNACPEPNPESATMLRAQADGSEREIYAEGLRNTIGFGWHPETGVFWGMDHGSDARGDDEPPEELNRLGEGLHYGWPYCYAERQPDVFLPMDPEGASKEEFCALTEPPVLTYQAHSAPIGMVFYTGEMFPEDYRNDAFIAMRGSWNRETPVGYKVVRLVFEDGEPTGFEDFLTGFLLEDGQAHFGRLAGVLVLQDGSLLVSEDAGGVIYRVSYAGE